MRRIIALMSSALLLVLGGVVAASPSTAEETVVVGGLEDKGTITLRTGVWSSSKEIVYRDAAESVVGRQSISNGCANPVEPGALLIEGSPETACFGRLGFGVGSGGWPSFLRPNVTGLESLSLSLAGPAADLEFSAFSLDVEAINPSGAPVVMVQAYVDGVSVWEEEFTLTTRVPGVLLPNYRIAVPKGAFVADTIVLSSGDGTTRFQLEGDTGSGSTFALTDITDLVTCGEEGGATSAGAELSIGGEGCEPEAVFFRFDPENNEVLVLKDPSDNEYRLTVPWTEPATYPVTATSVDYFDGAGSQPMVVCAGTTAEPTLPGDQIPATVEEDGWCVAGQGFELLGGGTMKVTEALYGKGDPRFNRL
jgi:hypothetical protein